MGVVSPNGIGKEAFCLRSSRRTIGCEAYLPLHPSSLPVHIAGEIPEFDELAWVDGARSANTSPASYRYPCPRQPKAIKDAGLNPAAMSMERNVRLE